MNKVVARFADGRLVKGTTADFFPAKDLFHVNVATAPAGAKPVESHTKDLKALFFVKDFAGDPQAERVRPVTPSSRAQNQSGVQGRRSLSGNHNRVPARTPRVFPCTGGC